MKMPSIIFLFALTVILKRLQIESPFKVNYFITFNIGIVRVNLLYRSCLHRNQLMLTLVFHLIWRYNRDSACAVYVGFIAAQLYGSYYMYNISLYIDKIYREQLYLHI